MANVIETIAPRDDSSSAANESLARIDLELMRIEAEIVSLKSERVDMLTSGASDADISRLEKALSKLALDDERLRAAEPAMRTRYSEAVKREAAELKADRCAIAAAAVLRFNEWMASGVYTNAATQILEGIELERQAYRLLREAAAGGPLPASVPVPTRAWLAGGSMRSLESSVQLPNTVPGPALHFWLDPNRPQGAAAIYGHNR
jgi:hypothetical protein